MSRMKTRMLCLVLLVVLVLSGCKERNKEEIVAYVGETPVTVSEFRFYLDNVKEQMQGTELSDDDDWQNNEIDGRKAIDVAKDLALDNATVNLAYIQIYKKMGKTLSDKDKTQIDEIKDEMVKSFDGGYDEFLKINNLTDEFANMLCKSEYCKNILYNEFAEENDASEEEMSILFEKYIDEKMLEYSITTVETELIKKIN